MRPLIFALAIAAMAAPVAALADDGPPAAPNPAAMQQHMAAFAQVHQQIETLHKQERAQFLAALSPAHKQLLAQIAGELAISPSPDFQGAARKLDASLSQSESQSILRAHDSYRQQERTIMENARAQFEKSLSPEQQQQMAQRHAQMGAERPNSRPQPTAGDLLLNFGHGPMPMMHPGM